MFYLFISVYFRIKHQTGLNLNVTESVMEAHKWHCLLKWQEL